jgi:hypothetical protein
VPDDDALLTPEEEDRLRRWVAGDDGVDLSSLFTDASAYPDISRAIRAAVTQRERMACAICGEYPVGTFPLCGVHAQDAKDKVSQQS